MRDAAANPSENARGSRFFGGLMKSVLRFAFLSVVLPCCTQMQTVGNNDGGDASASDSSANDVPSRDSPLNDAPISTDVTDVMLGDVGIDAVGGCPAPLLECGGRCVDTSTDEANCGGCGGGTHTCATGSFCVAGNCQNVSACPPPFVMC